MIGVVPSLKAHYVNMRLSLPEALDQSLRENRKGAMMIGGFLVAYQFYIRRPDIPVALARDQGLLYRFLLNAWYFDRIYDFIFVRPAMWLGRLLWKGGDGFVIDGFGPDGVSARVLDVTRNVVRLQTGYLYHYAFAMLIGVAAFITWFMFAGVH